MTDKKIIDLTELMTSADEDYFEIVDVSDTTDDITGTSKKIKKSNLAGDVFGLVDDDDYIASPNYTGGVVGTKIIQTLGSDADPDGTGNAAAIFQKIYDAADPDSPNPTLAVSITKRSADTTSRGCAIFAEATDEAGGGGMPNFSFIEGVRGHAVLIGGTLGSAYGAIFMAGQGTGIQYQYNVGVEAETRNQSGNDAPATFNKDSFAASFVASAHGTNKSDVGFITNPYSTIPFRIGVLVAEDSVSDSAFRSDAATIIGLDLASFGTQSYASIVCPNNSPIRFKNNAGDDYPNIINLDASDRLILGYDSAATLMQYTGGNIGVGCVPDDNALLDLTSVTQGLLPPRMTSTQRDAITTPPEGLVIYNTTTHALNFYNGSIWGAV